MNLPSSSAATLDVQSHAKGSSFHMAMLLLPKAKRKALLTLYALCRELDDAVDEAESLAVAQTQLDFWQAEMQAVFAGDTPQSALAQEFAAIHCQYVFDQADMQTMLDALRLDAEGRMANPTPAMLKDYCHGVASAVGLMSMQIFGCDQPQARPFAIALGHALQLTNILRDVTVDAKMGRVYLPQNTTPAELGTQARSYFAEADALAADLPTRNIAPALAMRDVYALYWNKLRQKGWQPAENGKIPLTKSEKATLAARASGYVMGRYKPVDLL